MKHLFILLASALIIAGCESQNKPERFRAEADSHAGHNHDHDHDHDHDHHHHHDGEHLELGTATTAGITYEAIQIGELDEDSHEQVIEIVLTEGSPRPAAARIWIGTEDAEGSVKTRAEGSGNMFDVHVELPESLPADSRLWVEMENSQGESATSSFELKR